MKDKKKSAFPRKYVEREVYSNGGRDIERYEEGMTLRDYFAAKAMQGHLSNSKCVMNYNDMVEDSYLIADKMLAERSKNEG